MIQKNMHLIHRLTFGPRMETIDRYLQLQPMQLVDVLIKESDGYQPLKGPLKKRFPYRGHTKGQRKDAIRQRVAMIRSKQNLNQQWLETMAHSDQQLREKIALFWHDHFATNIRNPVKTVEQINWIRKHALGSYKKLLIGVSKGAAMIDYLHNKQNTKDNPNEDFAREVLELFTLGEGNYTERDIQEAARAFTGWDYDQNGNFRVNPRHHDDGVKVFMGQEGNWSGDEILDIILADGNTARYLTSKLYYYLTGVPISTRLLEQYSTVFGRNYNVTLLIKKIVKSKHFYEASIQGTKIKSPIDLLVGSMRLMDLRFASSSLPKTLQHKMDQVLLYPPNVAGWRSGPDWVTTGTLIDRLTLCRNLYNNTLSSHLKTAELTTEGDELVSHPTGDEQLPFKSISLNQTTQWVARQGEYGLLALAELLFGRNMVAIEDSLILLNNQISTHTLTAEEAIITLTTLPEYQLH